MSTRALVMALCVVALAVSATCIASATAHADATTAASDGVAASILIDACAGVPRNTLMASCPSPCAAGAACIAYDQDPTRDKRTGCDYATASSDAYCPPPPSQPNANTCEFQCFAAFADQSAFRFVVPFEAPLGDAVARATPVNSSAPSRTTSDVPFQSNTFVRAIAKLDLAQSVTQVSIAGGRTEAGTRDQVVTMAVDPAIFVDAPQVTSVTLANMDLRASIPRLLLALPNGVTSLNLANTRMSKLPDDALTHMAQLETLTLRQNQLSSISPTAISLPKLKSLYLSENSIKTFDVFAPNLEILDLSGNELSSIPSVVFSLPKLRTLKLDGNPIQTPVVVTASQAAFLQGLSEVSLSIETHSPSNESTSSSGDGSAGDAGRPKNSVVVIGGRRVEIEATVNTTNFTIPSTAIGSLSGDDEVGSPSSSLDGAAADEDRSKRDVPAASSVPQSSSHPSTADKTVASKDKDSHQSSPLAVVLIVVGVVVATLGLAAGLKYQRKRKLDALDGLDDFDDSERAPYAKLPNEDSGHTQISCTLERETTSGSPFWVDSELFSYRVGVQDIQDVRIIGTGCATVVWLVHYRSSTRQLASKRLSGDDMNALKLVAEVKLAASLSHPNIVQFFGVAWTNDADLQALYEYMPQGDLYSYFSRSKVSSASWQWLQDKVKVAFEVIEALVYAHAFDPPLLHRDLRSKNVLLDGEFKAKLCDFGSPISFRERSTLATITAGSGLLSLAPEILSNSSPFDTSSDIYSFGVLLTELDTHHEPFATEREDPSFSTVGLLVRVSSGELKPSLSVKCPPAIRQIARACMAFEASHRPTAIQVASMLKLMLPPGYGG